MKEITAIIRTHRLVAVLDALHVHPELPGVTLSDILGFGIMARSCPQDSSSKARASS